MQTSLIIYIRALGIYALITILTLPFPIMYFMSLYLVFIYGWFACLAFALANMVISVCKFSLRARYFILAGLIPFAVAFGFQMIETFGAWDNVWHAGGFLLFPLAGIISGWISLYISYNNIKKKEAIISFDFASANNNTFIEK